MKSNSRIKPIERATKRTWDEWLQFMESIDAKNLDHHDIALNVYKELDGTVDSPGWWSQGVTVAYEQYIGRRIPGQRSDGTFETSVSRSTQLGMKELMDKWVDFAAQEQAVLDLVIKDVKVGGTDKRITWRTKARDGSSIMITSEPKANGTASIIATQIGIQTEELNIEAKSKWTSIVNRFLKQLQ